VGGSQAPRFCVPHSFRFTRYVGKVIRGWVQGKKEGEGKGGRRVSDGERGGYAGLPLRILFGRGCGVVRKESEEGKEGKGKGNQGKMGGQVARARHPILHGCISQRFRGQRVLQARVPGGEGWPAKMEKRKKKKGRGDSSGCVRRPVRGDNPSSRTLPGRSRSILRMSKSVTFSIRSADSVMERKSEEKKEGRKKGWGLEHPGPDFRFSVFAIRRRALATQNVSG